ncbi:hypothetical protein Tco_1090580 [Tanacetum coccineum]|uniref:Uncharacterized protein n=1 Tax=Tanacetum coccineum TaxID=301880 RepID=A0ABQ5I6T4_9ASTR
MSKAKERCMAYFRSLHSHLQVLSKGDSKGTRIEHGFKREFMSLFGQDVDTFTRIMLLNVDQLQKSQLAKMNFLKMDHDSLLGGIEVQHFRRITLLQHLGHVKKSLLKAHIIKDRQQHTEQPEIINEGEIHVLRFNSIRTRCSNKPLDPKESKLEYWLEDPFNQGHRWIPTRKLFYSCTSKVDSEPPQGSNVDIPNIHECKQTLDVSAGTSINVQKEQSLDLSVVVLKSSAVTTTDASNKRQQQPDSTSSTSTLATTVTANGNFDL